jgi:hypothetical protein
MNADHLLPIISLCVWGVTFLGIFIGRNWLVARITKGVQHDFDLKIEEVRTEFRKREESFKSELRNKETELSTLRASVLAGSANRQSLLDKRRFEAVERVWTTVNDLAQSKYFASMMALLDYKELAKSASDPRMQQFLRIIGDVAPDIKKFKDVARDERPFLPDLAWAYFSAYKSILVGSHIRFEVLKSGVDEPQKLLTSGGSKTILKAALPHQAKFIDENEPETYYYLLEEIEASLLAELRKILEGTEADQSSVARAKGIMDTIEAERARQVADEMKNVN